MFSKNTKTGNGDSKPLSLYFNSMLDAKKAYPSATSLSDELDWCVIQSAIDYAEKWRGTVFIPDGVYIINKSLLIPSFITIKGESNWGCVIDNQWTPLNAPQMINKYQDDFINVSISNLVFRGGTHGLKIDINLETAGNRFNNLTFELQTSMNIQINKLMQTTIFENCIFDGAPYGIVVDNPTSNANTFINCSFTRHKWEHIILNGSEDNNFIGCRFEQGGEPGKTTIYAISPRSLSFDGCYFENTHTNALLETNSSSSTNFNNCHFTGASNALGQGFDKYKFISDGIVNFGTNTWHMKSDGSDKMMIYGQNRDMLGNNNIIYESNNKNHTKIISKWMNTPINLKKDLFEIKRENLIANLDNIQMLIGELEVRYLCLTESGFEINYSRKYSIHVKSFSNDIIKCDIKEISNCDCPRDSSLHISSKYEENSLIIEARFYGLVPSTELSSAFQYSLDVNQMSTNVEGFMKIDIV